MRGVYIAFTILLIVAVFGTLQLGLQRFEGFTTESSPDCCGITSDTPPITAAEQAITTAQNAINKSVIDALAGKDTAAQAAQAAADALKSAMAHATQAPIPSAEQDIIQSAITAAQNAVNQAVAQAQSGTSVSKQAIAAAESAISAANSAVAKVPKPTPSPSPTPSAGVPGEDGGGVFHPPAESECPSGVQSTNINIYLGTRGLRSGTQPGSIGGLPKRRAPIPSALIPSSMLPSPAETSGSNGLQTYPTQLDQGTTATLHHDQIRVPTSELYFGAAGAGASSGSAMAGAGAGTPGISQGTMAGQEAADWTGSLGDAPVSSNPLGSFAQKERITGMAQRLANTWLNAGAGALGGLLPQSQPDGPTLATGTNPYMYASGTTNQYYPFGNQIGQSSNIYKNLGASQ